MTLVHKAHLCQSTAAIDNIFALLYAKNVVQSLRCDQLTSFLASLHPRQTLIFTLSDQIGTFHGYFHTSYIYLRAFKNMVLKKVDVFIF